MPNIELDLNPVDFITIGTVGPKGQRVFHLQAGKGEQIVTLTIEKEQAGALGEAIRELIDDLDRRTSSSDDEPLFSSNMELRDPVEPLFRVAQMGLGYDEEQDKVVLIAQELLPIEPIDEEIEIELEPDTAQPGVVRLWCTRTQMRALSDHSSSTVQAGRADPKQNGRLVYYWT